MWGSNADSQTYQQFLGDTQNTHIQQFPLQPEQVARMERSEIRESRSARCFMRASRLV
jgi:hypothetical protein